MLIRLFFIGVFALIFSPLLRAGLLGEGSNAQINSTENGDRVRKVFRENIYEANGLFGLKEYWILRELGILAPSHFSVAPEGHIMFEMDKGEPVSSIVGVSPEENIPWLADINELLQRAHQKKIAHLNIKLSHIIKGKDGNYGLIGWSMAERHAYMPQYPEYFATFHRSPDAWRALEENAFILDSFTHDLWALGMTGLEYMGLVAEIENGDELKDYIVRQQDVLLWPTEEGHSLFPFLQESAVERRFLSPFIATRYLERLPPEDDYSMGVNSKIRAVTLNWLYEISTADLPFEPVYVLDAFAIHDALCKEKFLQSTEDDRSGAQLRGAIAYQIAMNLHSFSSPAGNNFEEIAESWYRQSGSVFEEKWEEEGRPSYYEAFKKKYQEAVEILGSLGKMPSSPYALLEETPPQRNENWSDDEDFRNLFIRLCMLIDIYHGSATWWPAQKAYWAFAVAKSLQKHKNIEEENNSMAQIYRRELESILSSYKETPDSRFFYIKDIKDFISKL